MTIQLRWVIVEYIKPCTWFTCVCACIACSCVCMLTCLTCSRACVLSLLRVGMLGVGACSRAHVLGVLVCLHVRLFKALDYSACSHVLHGYCAQVFYVLTCFMASFSSFLRLSKVKFQISKIIVNIFFIYANIIFIDGNLKSYIWKPI